MTMTMEAVWTVAEKTHCIWWNSSIAATSAGRWVFLHCGYNSDRPPKSHHITNISHGPERRWPAGKQRRQRSASGVSDAATPLESSSLHQSHLNRCPVGCHASNKTLRSSFGARKSRSGYADRPARSGHKSDSLQFERNNCRSTRL